MIPNLTPERRAALREWMNPTGEYSVFIPARELTALLDAADERDTLAAQVQRVREVAEQYDADARHEPYGGGLWSTTAAAINAALRGESA